MNIYPLLDSIRRHSIDDPVMAKIKPLNEKSLENEKYKKNKIPKALREQVWKKYTDKFEIKCPVRWCENRINSFDFHVGHNIPESKGGTLDISNLKPICSRCNLSMGALYTIDEWEKLAVQSSNNKCSCTIM